MPHAGIVQVKKKGPIMRGLVRFNVESSYFSIPKSSISKISAAFGPISSPAPRSP